MLSVAHRARCIGRDRDLDRGGQGKLYSVLCVPAVMPRTENVRLVLGVGTLLEEVR